MANSATWVLPREINVPRVPQPNLYLQDHLYQFILDVDDAWHLCQILGARKYVRQPRKKDMNILNQSPSNGINGHSVFPAPRGPRPSSPHHHQDACQHLLPVALPPLSPASSTLRSFHPTRSTRAPLIVDANGGSPPRDQETFHRAADGANLPALKAQGGQMRSAAVGSMEDICNFSHLLDGSDESHFKFPADPTAEHYHLSRHDVAEEGERKACNTLGLIHSLMEEDKFSLIQEYHFLGDHLDQRLFSPEEPPSVLTLAVSVSSAVKLKSKQIDQIAKKMRRLTGFKSLRMENKVDPSLIAGFVISYGVGDAHVIDLSVKGRLAQLEAQLQSSDKSTGVDGWSFPSSGDSSY